MTETEWLDYEWQLEWDCPATKHSTEPAQRGHRFAHTVVEAKGVWLILYCQRCGRTVPLSSEPRLRVFGNADRLGAALP